MKKRSKAILSSKTPPPGWPTEEEWKVIEKKLEKKIPSRMLPDDASIIDRFKFKMCEQFVIYLHDEEISQRALAKKLGTTEARVSEIVHYHLDKVTADRLINYLGIIKPNAKIKVA